MDILGDSIEQITKHKAGIIKENSETVVIEQGAATSIIKKTCAEKNNKVHIIKKEDIKNYKLQEYQIFDYKKHKNIKINLRGKVQTENAAEVLETIDIFRNKGFNITNHNVREGLGNVIHRARLQMLSKEPLIIFDGGHNESAIKSLRENIKDYYSEYKNRVYIVSILKTKEYEKIVQNLCMDKKAIFIFTSGINNNYILKEELCDIAKKYIQEKNIIGLEFENGINIAKKKYKNNLVLIVGSFYVYKKTCELLGVK